MKATVKTLVPLAVAILAGLITFAVVHDPDVTAGTVTDRRFTPEHVEREMYVLYYQKVGNVMTPVYGYRDVTVHDRWEIQLTVGDDSDWHDVPASKFDACPVAQTCAVP